MQNSKTIGAAALAASAALLFLASESYADAVRSELGGPLKLKCFGANACKGQGACGTTSNACRGHNACKGQGFETLGQLECAQRLGRG